MPKYLYLNPFWLKNRLSCVSSRKKQTLFKITNRSCFAFIFTSSGNQDGLPVSILMSMGTWKCIKHKMPYSSITSKKTKVMRVEIRENFATHWIWYLRIYVCVDMYLCMYLCIYVYLYTQPRAACKCLYIST